jgi:Ca2+-binding EF-hand superfamily protein
VEAPKATEQEKTAPVFGSGSTAPVFGSGSGFAALASSPAGVEGKTQSSTGFGFGFGGSSAASSTDPPPKPLYGSSSSAEAAEKTQGDTVGGSEDSDGNETGIALGSPVELPDTDEAKTAAAVFDSLDEGKEGRVSASMFEALTDELGEGFHGDEFDKQLAIIDPEGTGFIARSSFAAWYSELVLGGSGSGGADSDAGSLDTEEREEREEERQNADQAFTATAGEGVDTLAVSAFGDLIESMGTTYCEEEHRRTIKKISEDGTISRGAFIIWYLDWLFGGDESDIESDDNDDGEGDDGHGAGGASSASVEGWGGAFGVVEEGSWKCDACMVRNKAADVMCAACETVRPGHEAEAAAALSDGGSGGASAASGSGIGAGGFSAAAVPAPAPAPLFGSSSAPSSSGGGFMFGTPAAAAPGPAPAAEIGGGGFTFGVKPAASTPTRPSTKASPSLTREKSLQGSLEAKIRGMNESPSTPPQKVGSNFASQGQELDHEDKPPSEVKCEACGWRTAEINAPNEGTPTRERRCASCKARQLKYSGSPAKQAHKGGSH